MLDPKLISPSHLVFFVSGFLAEFLLLRQLILHHPQALRHHATQKNVQYAGSIIALVTLAFVVMHLGLTRLTLGLTLATLVCLYRGGQDEKSSSSPASQFLSQVVIALILITTGWMITHVTNPFATGIITIDTYQLAGLPVLSIVLTTVWLLLIINSINWLDGIDGLAPTVGSVAFACLALVSLLPSIQDGRTLTLAIIGAGTLSAFAIWNWSPAKVYLGTTGSWFIGMFIGIVAIIGGGKIVTTLIILAIPIIDAMSVMLQRLVRGQPVWQGDTVHHAHHHLLNHNLKPPHITTIAGLVTLLLGVGSILFPSPLKLFFVIVATLVLTTIFVISLLNGRIKTVIMLHKLSSRITWTLIAVAVLVAIAVISYQATYSRNISNCPDFSDAVITINNQQINIGETTTEAEKALGLGGCQQLDPDQGLFFTFDFLHVPEFWMKNMRIPIDIIWIRDNTIVAIEENVPPPPAGTTDQDLLRYHPPKPVNKVLEIAAGQAEKRDFKIGDRIEKRNNK